MTTDRTYRRILPWNHARDCVYLRDDGAIVFGSYWQRDGVPVWVHEPTRAEMRQIRDMLSKQRELIPDAQRT